jgi:hypothetical protein
LPLARCPTLKHWEIALSRHHRCVGFEVDRSPSFLPCVSLANYLLAQLMAPIARCTIANRDRDACHEYPLAWLNDGHANKLKMYSWSLRLTRVT